MTPWDMWVAMREQVPYFLFTSPPCKGLSGLLPEKSAKSEKYQALNQLTVRGIELVLMACLMYGGGLPAFIQLENVPRIQTRGKSLLEQIKKMLKKYGYAVNMRGDHNLGEIGALGQSRMRFLIMARQESQVPMFMNYPQRKKLRTIGDVIGPLPLPGDTVNGGPMHRLPQLQWKTWVRLALIRAGGDWRDLQSIPFDEYRIVHEPRGGAYAVEDWEKPARTVTGTAGPGRSNGAAAVSDPRFGFGDGTHQSIYRISKHDEPGPTVTETSKSIRAASRIMQSASSISDPRLSDNPKRYTDKYRMQSMDDPAATVTGVTDVQSGAQLVADVRLGCSPRSGSYGVQAWDEPGKTVVGAGDIHSGTCAIADPRPFLADNERGVWTIIAPDGTVHRPLTTFENAMLQGFPHYLPNGHPFQLEGCSDAKAREYIGNAVPPPSAQAMGNEILLAAAQAEVGKSFTLSWNEVWVAPIIDELPVMVH